MGKVIKNVALAFVFLVCALFILRCCLAADKSKFSAPQATDALRQAWADGDSELLTCRVEAELAEDGYFAAYGFFWNPESGEVQLAVRWNNSVYRYTDMPEGHEFSFILRDETTGESWPGRTVASDKLSIYNYRKLIFDGVNVGEGDLLTAIMELRDGFESRQVLKYEEQPMTAVKLKKAFLEQVGQ